MRPYPYRSALSDRDPTPNRKRQIADVLIMLPVRLSLFERVMAAVRGWMR